jgi:mono/diheme cytochrome c family protein
MLSMRRALSLDAAAPAFFAFILFSGEAFGGATATGVPDPNHGNNLATSLCSNCHLVDSVGQEQANVDIPSFAEIANKVDQSSGAIMAAIMLPKHPMPAIPLTKNELADLAAYILSLRADEGAEE